MNNGTIVAFVYVIAVFIIYTQFLTKESTSVSDARLQTAVVILYFAAAAVIYEVVLTKLAPSVPPLAQIVGSIVGSII